MTKKAFVLGLFLVFLFNGMGVANQFQLGFKANQAALGADFGYTYRTDYGAFVSGANVVLNNDSEDEYKILRGKIFVTTDPLLPGLRYGIGFESMLGLVEDEKRGWEGDLFALGFLFHMGYNHHSGKSQIPADVALEITLAPDPLTSNDTELYWGFNAGVEFGILNNASISLEYRYMNIEFETHSTDWHVSDGLILLGYTIRF